MFYWHENDYFNHEFLTEWIITILIQKILNIVIWQVSIVWHSTVYPGCNGPIIKRKLLYKTGHYFLDIQYVYKVSFIKWKITATINTNRGSHWSGAGGKIEHDPRHAKVESVALRSYSVFPSLTTPLVSFAVYKSRTPLSFQNFNIIYYHFSVSSTNRRKIQCPLFFPLKLQRRRSSTTASRFGSVFTQKSSHFCRDEDPDPVGSDDFWPAGSRSVTFFIGSGS